MTYRSKVDAWLVAVLASAVAITVAASTMLIVGGDAFGIVLGLVPLSVMLGAILCVLPCRYDIEDDELVVQTGHEDSLRATLRS